MILTLRTDSPDAEIGLYSTGGEQLSYYQWHADRRLAKELLREIRNNLLAAGSDWQDISGLVVFEGPGSFTGLRIGITVANTLAYSLDKPIVAAKGEHWLEIGMDLLKNGHNDRLVLPHYGSEAHITLPKR
jgi:tRNA threonylcarbamoyladenosine biosynthesis protein TsaB